MQPKIKNSEKGKQKNFNRKCISLKFLVLRGLWVLGGKSKSKCGKLGKQQRHAEKGSNLNVIFGNI